MDESLLIVDDDDAFRERLARALRERGYSVQTAANAAVALQTLDNTPFTHATVDLTLDLFYGQDFAVKAAKILSETATRNGKPKGFKTAILEGRVPNVIPEPTTAVLMVLGLGGLSYAGRARKI